MDELIRDMRDAADVILALPPYSRSIVSPAVQLAVMAQKAADELEKRRWVSFDEKLPEDGQEILLGRPSYDHVVVTIYHELLGPGCTHTHWMPSPEGPKEDDT